jgi:hypothetical protein
MRSAHCDDSSASISCAAVTVSALVAVAAVQANVVLLSEVLQIAAQALKYSANDTVRARLYHRVYQGVLTTVTVVATATFCSPALLYRL